VAITPSPQATFGSFVTAVGAYGIFPHDWIPFLVGVLIMLEMALGVLFFLPRTQGLAGGVASVLLAGFMALALYARILGLEGDCGCFGFVRSNVANLKHILQNGILLIFSIAIYLTANGASRG